MSAEEDRDFAIDDPEELSQKKRINELLHRRKSVIDARDAAIEAQLMGQTPRADALQYYRSRIESLIIDLWTKFKNDEIDVGKEFLEQREIDTIRVDPPASFPRSPDDEDLAPGATPPAPKQVRIRGLKWFLENEGAIQVPFTVRMDGDNGPGQRTEVQEVSVPLTTLDKALLTCTEFLDEAGIDADLTTKEQQTRIDRDLLEEVEEWRKQNVE